MKNPGKRAEYTARVNRVLDYIEEHLAENMTLDELAKVAHFSRYHFHRIFRSLMGESLNQFINRLRVERAATFLLSYPYKSITEIAFDCGFSCSASFARAFKKSFSMSASSWRKKAFEQKSKNGQVNRKNDQTNSKDGKDVSTVSCYFEGITGSHLTWRLKMKENKELTVEVKNFPEMEVAYIRNVGPYKGNSDLFKGLFEKLMQWAGPRGLFQNPDTKTFTIYHDNPEITDEEKLRISVCITIPNGMEVGGNVSKMTMKGGEYGVAHFEIHPNEYQDAWNAVYGHWLPESGYQPDDRPSLEFYKNIPSEHPEGKHLVDICIPVKPL